MARNYIFAITLRTAEFDNGFCSVPYSGGTKEVYHDAPFVGTLADVLAERVRLSAAESRPHVAFIRMASRNERKPANFDKLTPMFQEPRDKVPA